MRHKLDFYETPDFQVKALTERVNVQGKVFEPCCGDGAISRFFPGCITNDIDVEKKADIHLDATEEAVWNLVGGDPLLPLDWVVTNPPFNQAFKIAQWAVSRAYSVALLLRISFLEPTKERGPWLASLPPTVVIVLPRHSYTGNGKSDSTTTAWMVWSGGGYMHPGIAVANEARRQK